MLREEEVVVNHDAAVHVHLSRDDDLSSTDNANMTIGTSDQRLVVRCSGMPTQSSALSRLERILLQPQFTDITILLSNGVSQLPLEVFSTVFASKQSIERLQLFVSGRSTSTDGLVALLGCWRAAQHELPRLTVGCTWHHPRPAAQWHRLNYALHQLAGSKIGILQLEKLTLRTLPQARSLELALCQAPMLPQTTANAGPTAASLVLQPLPQAVPGIVKWLQQQHFTSASPSHRRLGLDVYRLSAHQVTDLLEAATARAPGQQQHGTLAILGLRHSHHMEALIQVLPKLRCWDNLEVEYMDHSYMRHQWPTHQLVRAVHANWHLQAMTLRRRTTTASMTSTAPLLDAKQRTVVEQALQRNRTVATWDEEKDTCSPYMLGRMLQLCPDVSLATTWLLTTHGQM